MRTQVTQFPQKIKINIASYYEYSYLHLSANPRKRLRNMGRNLFPQQAEIPETEIGNHHRRSASGCDMHFHAYKCLK